jgi:hypothetical protein
MQARLAYLILSVLGFLLPYSQFLPWLREHGFDWQEFRYEMFENRIASFFVYDVLVAAGALLVFMIVEGARVGVRHLWAPILGTFLVGVSFALPLFLFLREERLRKA